MNGDLILVVVFVVLAIGGIVWVLVSLTRRLREERGVQASQDRSPLWLLIAAAVGAYLFAYFAFGKDLQAPMRLAFAVLVAASFSAVRRLLP